MKASNRTGYFQMLLEQGLKDGTLRLPSPLGDFRIPSSASVTDVSFKEKYIQALTNPDEAEQSKQCALKGVRSFREYLNGARFPTLEEGDVELKAPEFAYTTKVDELYLPEMQSFYYEPRVVVRLVRELGGLYEVAGVSNYGFCDVPFIVEKKLVNPLKFTKTLYYTDIGGVRIREAVDSPEEVREETRLDVTVGVKRYPIIFNADPDNLLPAISRYASLASTTLFCHLESYIIRRAEEKIRKQGHDVPKEKVDEILDQENERSALISRALTEDWLIKGKRFTGYDEKEIMEFIEFLNIDEKKIKKYLSVKRILAREGPKKTLETLFHSIDLYI